MSTIKSRRVWVVPMSQACVCEPLTIITKGKLTIIVVKEEKAITRYVIS